LFYFAKIHYFATFSTGYFLSCTEVQNTESNKAKQLRTTLDGLLNILGGLHGHMTDNWLARVITNGVPPISAS